MVVLGNSRIWNHANVTRRIGTICEHLTQLLTSTFPSEYLAWSYSLTCHFQRFYYLSEYRSIHGSMGLSLIVSQRSSHPFQTLLLQWCKYTTFLGLTASICQYLASVGHRMRGFQVLVALIYFIFDSTQHIKRQIPHLTRTIPCIQPSASTFTM